MMPVEQPAPASPPVITVIKRNHLGEETWRYSGEELQRWPTGVQLQAYFDREDRTFHGMMLCKGDRFVEWYYTDRWYNIFEIHARQDDSLRGWYCNITRPAELYDGRVEYVDLALDLLVFPDGRQLVLDEDEFAALNLPEPLNSQARLALNELQVQFAQR